MRPPEDHAAGGKAVLPQKFGVHPLTFGARMHKSCAKGIPCLESPFGLAIFAALSAAIPTFNGNRLLLFPTPD